MKFLFVSVLCTAILGLIGMSEQAWSGVQKPDRGACINLAKQKYGRDHKLIWAATRRCLSGGPGAV